MEQINDVRQLSMEEMWNQIAKHEDEIMENEEHRQEFLKVRNGYKIKVPIYYIIYGKNKTSQRNHLQYIEGAGEYKLLDYYDEIRKRKETMARLIEEYEVEEEATSHRLLESEE